MAKFLTIAAGLATAMSTATLAHAAAPMLNVNVGLWEITSIVNLGGAMPTAPKEDLAKLPPELRAQIQAMMSNASKPQVTKSCLTQKELEKGPNFSKENKSDCTQTVLEHTATTLKIKQVCSGESPSTTTMNFTANSRKAMTGTFKSITTDSGKPRTIDGTIDGKWLSSDCGKLAPKVGN